MATSTTTYSPERTRNELLNAAYEEIWASGFRASSLEKILDQAGVTKGALYHHFKNKLDLGYAVVDELVRALIQAHWVENLAKADDPIQAIQELMVAGDEEFVSKKLRLGCPLTNLSQEMSTIDEGFRKRTCKVTREWRGAIADALRRGQENGTVRQNIDPDGSAAFILAVLTGSNGLAKNEQDPEILKPCEEGLKYYLEALRPRRSFRA